jgi:hypothetical protein
VYRSNRLLERPPPVHGAATMTRCPYCIGELQGHELRLDGEVYIWTEQVAHDRACPARRAPVGTRMVGLGIADITKENT